MAKLSAKSKRSTRVNNMTDSISDMQSRAFQSHDGTGMDCRGDYMDENYDVMAMGPPQKKPFLPFVPPIGPDCYTGSTLWDSVPDKVTRD